VKLSVKTDNAARAVLALAALPREGPACKVEVLAETVGTSANYLVQILIELKAKAPEEITLGMVWRASEGSILDVPAIADEDCPAGLREAWKSARASLTESADQITFAQILEASGRDREMYYI